jgi:hypothetical protein
MNVILMVQEINVIANPMIRKPALPDFSLSANHRSEGVRVSALDELNGMFERYGVSWRQEKMDMFGHNHERVELKAAFAAIAIKSLQEEADIIVYHKQPSSLPR